MTVERPPFYQEDRLMFARRAVLGLSVCVFLASTVHGADHVEVSLAGTRTHFTVAEPIELAILYQNNGGNLAAIPLEIRHVDGSLISVEVPIAGLGQSQTRLVTLPAGALKPGKYSAASTAGAETPVEFSVYPAEHKNDYWVGQWVHHGESWQNTQAKGGWMYMTSDFATLHARPPAANDPAEGYLAARMKPYVRMVLGGGHQLDLELVNDWGDPWVQRTILWRMQLAALSNRIHPIAGLHCFDEPGLTWFPTQDVEGYKADINPFSIPHQLEEFEKLTGKRMPAGPFSYTGPQYAERMEDWLAFMDMRMKYLEQAWHATVMGTESAAPRFSTINQVSSSYAPGTTTDGVSSQQNRPYDIVSGHGGYSDLPFGTFQPVRSAEGMQGFTRGRPHYHLPMWYTHSWATIRNAVWMSWTTKLEGMNYTPEQDFGVNGTPERGYLGTNTVFEIAELNRRLALVGGVMRQLPKSLSPVAVLHSHRQVAYDIATLNHPKIYKIGAPQYANLHGPAIDACFFRVMENGLAPNWIDETEATEGGAEFLRQWKVIFCPRLSTASPSIRAALEGYVAAGGKLIQAKGDKLLIEGSIVADHEFGNPTQYYLERVGDAGITDPDYRDLAWRDWNNAMAPTFGEDLAGWIGERPFWAENRDVLLGVHQADEATYLLFANNAQDRANPRAVKHELIPTETAVRLPRTGVVYDLFEGGKVPVDDCKASLRLAAGDGACWLHLPDELKEMKLVVSEAVVTGETVNMDPEDGAPVSPVVEPAYAGPRLHVEVTWGTTGYLPIRLRIFDPAGNTVDDLLRATAPAGHTTRFVMDYPLGANASPGDWTVEASEWLTGTTVRATVHIESEDTLASVDEDPISIYEDDEERISTLLAGQAPEPEYEKLNWDARRVFGLDPKKFAVFGPEDAAGRIAAALTSRGLVVLVNPPYEIKPFEREPGRGGAGAAYGVGSNLDNIFAHTIVLPGHPLAAESARRGHINRPVTNGFPGPGRAYVQWGVGCYQPGWNNVFILGDMQAGLEWLLMKIEGGPAVPPMELPAKVRPAEAARPALPGQFAIEQEIELRDTPVGVGTSKDGKLTYVLEHGGIAAAYDADGNTVWRASVLLEGGALAVSPKGDRVAVAGYPGLFVLDAADGRVLGGFKAPPDEKGHTFHAKRMIAAAWNDAGTLVAGGWANNKEKPLGLIVLDQQGQLVGEPRSISGNVMGVAFVPNSDTLLVGADKLTAVDAQSGQVRWTNDLGGAQAFAFTPDGETAAAGGWGHSAGKFRLQDGQVTQQGTFDSVVGGVALMPSGDLAVAVWGGTRPLFVLRGTEPHPQPEALFQSAFGFQDVLWSEAAGALVAAEQGGELWLLSPDGKPQAVLDEEAGTTIYRLEPSGDGWLVGRMNRVVQRIGLN
jgi:hypothetical protein